MSYGLEVYDDNGLKYFGYNDRMSRIFWSKIVEPHESGSEIVPGVYKYDTPYIVATALIIFTDDDWLVVLDDRIIPETSHTVTYRRIGDNLLVEWQPNPFEAYGGLFCGDAQDYSIIFVYGW